jgi:hypothetical protein
VEQPAVDDTEDPLVRGLPRPTEADLPWVTAYRHVSDKRLPRPLRVFGYKLLHAALGVGGARVYAARNMQQLLDCCCKLQQQQCQPPQQPQAVHRSERDCSLQGSIFFYFFFLGTLVTMSGVKQHAGTHQKVRQENGTT